MSIRTLTLVVGTAVAVLVGGLMVHRMDRHRPQPPPRSLLLPALRGPGHWNTATVHTTTYDNVASRNWAHESEDFGELAYAYSSERAAKNAFRTTSPDKTTKDIFAGARRDDIGVRAAGADQAQFTCGETENEVCTTWWAWLRFGTKNVLLMYRHTPGDPQALTDAELAELATNAAGDVAKLAR